MAFWRSGATLGCIWYHWGWPWYPKRCRTGLPLLREQCVARIQDVRLEGHGWVGLSKLNGNCGFWNVPVAIGQEPKEKGGRGATAAAAVGPASAENGGPETSACDPWFAEYLTSLPTNELAQNANWGGPTLLNLNGAGPPQVGQRWPTLANVAQRCCKTCTNTPVFVLLFLGVGRACTFKNPKRETKSLILNKIYPRPIIVLPPWGRLKLALAP